MAVVRWEPFRELSALHNEMARWLGQLPGNGATNGQGSTWLPPVDAWETDEELVLAFDLPGIAEDDIAVELDDNVLTVSGERTRESERSGDRFYRYERRFGAFSRSVSLPQGVNENDIRASYANGVLEVRVPKPQEQKPKRIQVGTGAIEGSAKRT